MEVEKDVSYRKGVSNGPISTSMLLVVSESECTYIDL